MAVPAALSGGVASSLGCIGNRVYTDVGDDEFYSVIAGADLDRVSDALATILSANQTLADVSPRTARHAGAARIGRAPSHLRPRQAPRHGEQVSQGLRA